MTNSGRYNQVCQRRFYYLVSRRLYDRRFSRESNQECLDRGTKAEISWLRAEQQWRRTCHTWTWNYYKSYPNNWFISRIPSRYKKKLKDSQVLLCEAPLSEALIRPAIESKVQNVRLMNERLTCLEPHQVLALLKNYFSMSELQYILRAFPSYKYGDALHEFDQLIRSTLSQKTNAGVKCHCLFVLTV